MIVGEKSVVHENTSVRRIHKLPLLSAIQTYRAIRKWCEIYLTYVVDTEKEETLLEKILVVKDLPDVFPDDIPGLSPDRKV